MKKKILVVDDSATAHLLFKAYFHDEKDYELLQASTWQDAMQLAKTEQLALVVFDYNMPEKVGTELAALMRAEGVTAPFALMSANTQRHVLDETESLGFIHVVEKPVTANAVRILLEKIQ